MSDTNESKIPPVGEAYGGGDGGPNGMGIAKPDAKPTDEQAPTKETPKVRIESHQHD
jgi:hypothetical protein